VLEEFRNAPTGTTFTVYTYGTDLIGRSVVSGQSSVVSYFGYDGLGSVRFLTNAAGTITDEWDYDAFGILIHSSTSTSDLNSVYGYRGEQFDPDLGTYYLRARFYNQGTGRFWNQDSYEGRVSDPASLHKYIYAHADPVNGHDPSGLMFLTELQVVQAIQNSLRGSASVSLRVAVRKGGCYAFEWGIEQGIEQGFYFFLDGAGAYVGRSVDIDRRLGEHVQRITQKLGRITASAGVTPAQMADIEQYLLERLRDAVGVGNEDLAKNRTGISNKRNERNKSVREFLRKNVKLCK